MAQGNRNPHTIAKHPSNPKSDLESGVLNDLHQDDHQIKPDFFDSAPLSIVITDNDSRINYINPRSEQLFGYTFDEIRGKKIEILVPDHLRKNHIKHRDNFMKSPHTRPMGIGMDLLGRKKNGETFPVEIGLNYRNFNNDIQIVCYINDISKRIQFEEILEKQNNFLSSLHETSLNILGRLDLEQVLESIVTKAAGLMECDYGQIYLYKQQDEILEKSIGFGKDKNFQPEFEEYETELIKKIITTGDPVINKFSINDENTEIVNQEGAHCIMGVPLISGENIIGAICIAGEVDTQSSPDLISTDMIKHFGELASIAIQNAQLFSELDKKQQKMDRELRIASAVQVGLLPSNFPEVQGWSFGSKWKPAYEVAGDYYDFVVRKDGCFDIIIADVTDKGVPAALFMAHSKTLLRSSLGGSSSLLESLVRTNQAITDEGVGPFVTIFLARVDPRNGDLRYINAGHEPTLVYHAENDEIIELTQTGLPIGLDDTLSYKEESTNLGVNDFMVLYTDGVTEAMDKNFNQFGKDKLKTTIMKLRQKDSDEIAAGILDSVEKHIGSSIPSDDIAIVVAKRKE